MRQPPHQPGNDEEQDDDSKRDMERHGCTGFHVAMNVRHQPAHGILHQQQRQHEPVEHLRGGPVLRTIGHQVTPKLLPA